MRPDDRDLRCGCGIRRCLGSPHRRGTEGNNTEASGRTERFSARAEASVRLWRRICGYKRLRRRSGCHQRHRDPGPCGVSAGQPGKQLPGGRISRGASAGRRGRRNRHEEGVRTGSGHARNQPGPQKDDTVRRLGSAPEQRPGRGDLHHSVRAEWRRSCPADI